MTNEHEELARRRKAQAIHDAIPRDVTAEQLVAFSADQRAAAARLADKSAPSDATWLQIVELRRSLERIVSHEPADPFEGLPR